MQLTPGSASRPDRSSMAGDAKEHNSGALLPKKSYMFILAAFPEQRPVVASSNHYFPNMLNCEDVDTKELTTLMSQNLRVIFILVIAKIHASELSCHLSSVLYVRYSNCQAG